MSGADVEAGHDAHTAVRYCPALGDIEPVVVCYSEEVEEIGETPLRGMLADLVECYGRIDSHGNLTLRMVRDILIAAVNNIDKALDTPLEATWIE